VSEAPLLVLGLGNPGAKYAHQRHNAGADAVQLMAERVGTRLDGKLGPAIVGKGRWEGRELVLALPRTYMNESGVAGARLLREFSLDLDSVLVIYDDLDLPLGRLRLRAGGTPGGHNGIRSLQSHWRSQQFARVRIGIGRPPDGVDPIEFVLGRPQGEERKRFEAACARAAGAALVYATSGLEEAMTQFNRTPAKDRPGEQLGG
jgi:PTH1 family peptidyl-tRNA hydrolase